MPAEYPETTLPEQIDPGYPDRIRRLLTPLDALAFDFRTDDEPDFPLEANGSASDPLAFETLSFDPRAPLTTGPDPAVTEGDFRLPDPVSDPFLDIDDQASGFKQHNQRLSSSGEHRLLYHAVWRQPVLNRSQAEAILITGGDRYGEHHELEGSVMLSFNVNRIEVDARLWVATFIHDDRRGQGDERRWREELRRRNDGTPVGEASPEPDFSLPPLPIQPDASATRVSPNEAGPPLTPSPLSRSARVPTQQTQDYRVTELGYMEQTRSMISNQLHYLDHPDFGVLVEVRPYLLPDPLGTD